MKKLKFETIVKCVDVHEASISGQFEVIQVEGTVIGIILDIAAND